jgi:phosphatidylglycerophosphate synthase
LARAVLESRKGKRNKTMLDAILRKQIDPVLTRWGRTLAGAGWTANQVTIVGLALGLSAAAIIAADGAGWLALTFLLAGRVADGLDGAVARASVKTDFGGYFDIVCDWVFYAAIPLAFVLRDPDANGVAGAALLASFYINGASFLGYAILAEKRGMQTRAQGEKSLYYSAGLLEGTETILFFAILCLWPNSFYGLAMIFAALCLATAAARLALAYKVFGRGQ